MNTMLTFAALFFSITLIWFINSVFKEIAPSSKKKTAG